MQKITISSPSDASQRVDKFLKKYLPNAPLGAIYKMLRTGKIKINGKKKDQTYKLEQDDEISFWISDDEIRGLQQTWAVSTQSRSGYTITKEDILFEDEAILVLNKPAGINVHPGDHKSNESSLIEVALDYFGAKYNSLTFKPALLHRIDRDTTGCIVIVKEKESLEFLLSELQGWNIEKIYHTVTFWIPDKRRGTFDDKLLRVENAKNEAKVRVDPDWQKAITHYEVLKSWNIGKNPWINIALCQCQIETGRTHQIRVHLSNHNCPILGDSAYGNKKINAFLRNEFAVHRQLLHAYRLTFTHPKTKKKLQIEAPYPKDFQSITYLLP